MAIRVNPFLLLLCLFTIISSSSSLKDDENLCVYNVYIRTGSIWKGGTDSIIGITLYTDGGDGIYIPNLEAWGGLMGSGHDYFERGNLDIFSGRGPCLSSPPCRLNLSSDGTGAHHGWYCNYVEVTSTGPHKSCLQQLFTVEQWLASDASPYELSATRDNCIAALPAARDGGHVKMVGVVKERHGKGEEGSRPRVSY